ncbi:ATP-binding cassette domain-containing protein [Paenibacillus lautus]|uniref:ATP-binding cassette domain-containing protein n=1 Tax=Paenibacillus lautus TaxID=1401 RepID=UPI001FE8A13C|nr:ATP-binding cassette domain-containing protein [Paenibacillus lautus]
MQAGEVGKSASNEGMQQPHLLSMKGLAAWYRAETDAVLSNLNLEIGPNQIIGLVGLNGAGKSTLLHVLSGIHRHYSLERLLWKNEETSLTSPAFKRSRYTVFSEDESFEYFTFEEYVRHVFQSYGQEVVTKSWTSSLQDSNFRITGTHSWANYRWAAGERPI